MILREVRAGWRQINQAGQLLCGRHAPARAAREVELMHREDGRQDLGIIQARFQQAMSDWP